MKTGAVPWQPKETPLKSSHRGRLNIALPRPSPNQVNSDESVRPSGEAGPGFDFRDSARPLEGMSAYNHSGPVQNQTPAGEVDRHTRETAQHPVAYQARFSGE